MAKKMNSSEMAREIRALTATMIRRPATDFVALYLMPARPLKPAVFPAKHRLKIEIDDETCTQVEHPVKIIHAG